MRTVAGKAGPAFFWILLCLVSVVACSPSQPPPAGAGLPVSPNSASPHDDDRLSADDSQAEIGALASSVLPLGIDELVAEDKIRLEPFYGLLPELAWSPDGRYLAIFAEKSGYGIWLFDSHSRQTCRCVQMVDRSGQRMTSLVCFGWDKDSKSLLYGVDGIQSDDGLLGQNGVQVRRVTVSGDDQAIAWLPGEGMFIRGWLWQAEDHRLIVHRGSKLWLVDTFTEACCPLKTDLPTWDGLFWVHISPAADHVVFPVERQLMILNVHSRQETLIGAEDAHSFHPVWSPDGERLTFLSARQTAQGWDYQMGEDGPLPPATELFVVSKDGHTVAHHISDRADKIGGPVWSSDGQRLAFLTAQTMLQPGDYPAVVWKRVCVYDPDTGTERELGQLSSVWTVLGGFAPNSQSLYVYNYETGGAVTVISYRKDGGQPRVLAEDAVDEAPVWWEGLLVFPCLTGEHDDYLDTQIYAHDLRGSRVQLTSIPGWKSAIRMTDRYLAYVCADNHNYPYPLSVVVQPLESPIDNISPGPGP